MRGYIIEKYNNMKGSYSCYRLLEEAKKLGVSLQIIGSEDTSLKDGYFYNDGKRLEEGTFLFNRSKDKKVKDFLSLTKHSYNQTNHFLYYNNKYHQLLAIKNTDIMTPNYLYGDTNKVYQDIIEQIGLPFVAKGLASSMGKEIYLITTKKEYASLPEANYLFEEYIATSYGKDLRVYVINNKVVACMKRQAREGFKANVALGANVTNYSITPEIQTIVQQISEVISLDYYGLDLLFGKTGFVFCELNVMAGLQGIEQATNVNIAKKIIQHIITKEKEQVIQDSYQSYLKAQPFLDYHALDSTKRHPELSQSIIETYCPSNNVVITGSKGKGTTARILAKLLENVGKVGLMTSPHILDFTDRIQINSQPINDLNFVNVMDQAITKTKDISLPEHQYISPIAIQAIASLEYFKQEQTDYQIFECGKGVRYDDVNNIKHKYAIINPIFLEHTRELGNSIEAIIEDKLAIITKETKYVFIAKQNFDIDLILSKVPSHCIAKIEGIDYGIKNLRYTNQGMIFDVFSKYNYQDISLHLYGKHMAKNTALALCAYETITKEQYPKKDIHLSVPGRLDIIRTDPFLLVDACIHERSSYEVLKVLEYRGLKKVVFVIAIPDDKDYIGVIETIQAYASKIILTKTKNPHYHFSDNQQKVLQTKNIPFEYIEEVGILEEDVCYLGTTAYVTEILNLLKGSENG